MLFSKVDYKVRPAAQGFLSFVSTVSTVFEQGQSISSSSRHVCKCACLLVRGGSTTLLFGGYSGYTYINNERNHCAAGTSDVSTACIHLKNEVDTVDTTPCMSLKSLDKSMYPPKSSIDQILKDFRARPHSLPDGHMRNRWTGVSGHRLGWFRAMELWRGGVGCRTQ
jgi:hypothetical protein